MIAQDLIVNLARAEIDMCRDGFPSKAVRARERHAVKNLLHALLGKPPTDKEVSDTLERITF